MRRGELPAMTTLGVCSLSRSPHSAEQDLQTTPKREELESLLFVLSVCLSIYHSFIIYYLSLHPSNIFLSSILL